MTISANVTVIYANFAGTTSLSLADDEHLTIAAGVSYVTTNGYADISSGGAGSPNSNIDVEGSITGGFAAISTLSEAGNEAVTVGSAGSVFSADDAIYIETVSPYLESIHNAGYIHGDNAGVFASETRLNLENSGTIASPTALELGDANDDLIVNDPTGLITGDVAIDGSGNDTRIGNSGAISGTAATGAITLSGNSETVSNSGAIQANRLAISLGSFLNFVRNAGTISVSDDDAIKIAGSGNYVENSGKITAEYDDVYILGSGGPDWVVNDLGGLIQADPDSLAIDVVDDAAHIVNRGELDGNVRAHIAGSTSTNPGNYTGALNMSNGDDVVRNAGEMTVDGPMETGVYFLGVGGGDDRLVNAAGGVINATGAIAVQHGAAGTFRLVNRGEIYGDIDLDGTTSVVNAGAIGGNIDFAVAAGLFINRDFVDGNVTFMIAVADTDVDVVLRDYQWTTASPQDKS